MYTLTYAVSSYQVGIFLRTVGWQRGLWDQQLIQFLFAMATPNHMEAWHAVTGAATYRSPGHLEKATQILERSRTTRGSQVKERNTPDHDPQSRPNDNGLKYQPVLSHWAIQIQAFRCLVGRLLLASNWPRALGTDLQGQGDTWIEEIEELLKNEETCAEQWGKWWKMFTNAGWKSDTNQPLVTAHCFSLVTSKLSWVVRALRVWIHATANVYPCHLGFWFPVSFSLFPRYPRSKIFSLWCHLSPRNCAKILWTSASCNCRDWSDRDQEMESCFDKTLLSQLKLKLAYM